VIALASIFLKQEDKNSEGGVANSSGGSEVISPHTTIQQSIESLGGVRPVETPSGEELDPMKIHEGSVTYGGGKKLPFYQWQVYNQNPRPNWRSSSSPHLSC